jgi:hypothetical protein
MVKASKRAIYMKKLLAAGVLAVLALWIGYSHGYHQGVREERRAWEATASADPAGALTAGGKITLGNETAHVRIYSDSVFRNPHSGPIIVMTRETAAVNVPDPRNYVRCEGFSP